MGRFNDGLIRTNSKCIGCNFCVKSCPVMGANISCIDKHDKMTVEVSDQNCTHCGKCISGCLQKAREYLDDYEAFKEDLKNKENISVIIDPAFYMEYPTSFDDALVYLKSLGVKNIYDGAVGGAISLYCNVKYIHDKREKDGRCDEFISHVCAGAANYFSSSQPETIHRFIPVQLPQICTAVYLRKYKNVNDKIALITPCVAIQDEIKSADNESGIDYVIGISNLVKAIPKNVLKSLREKYRPEMISDDLSFTFIQTGVFANSVLQFFNPEELGMSDSGINEELGMKVALTCRNSEVTHPLISEIMSCSGGCIVGPCIDDDTLNKSSLYVDYFKIPEGIMKQMPKDLNIFGRYEWLCKRFEGIDENDFYWESVDRFRQKHNIPKSVTDELYLKMRKDTKIKQNMNCQACGYESCYDFVSAVARGYTRFENCIHYVNDELRAKSAVDSFTGLPNQRAFFPAAAALVEAHPEIKYALYSGDINNLSSINELYGSKSGDKVIYAVAGKISEHIGRRGACARFGGGVFAICMEETKENEKILLESIDVDIKDTGVDFPISMKWGKCTINRKDDLHHQMGYAAFAYHACNDRSKNTLSAYTEDMLKVVETEAKITQRMRRAMEKNEYHVFLQPKFDHHSKRMVGAEVLTRWIEEDGNIISPGVFIPLFERNGFIVDLDRVVWKNSFAIMRKWINDGYNPIPLSVNISRISLETDGILFVLEALKDEYPECVAFIQFEITETAYSMINNDIFTRVQKIRDMGFPVAMDDFGSGYSSLNLLKDAPIDILKLDMGFLRGDTNYERGQIIINSVIDMARKINLDMVAEGVETKQQADDICKMGCNIIQGYFYAKPMPVEEFEAYLTKNGDTAK